MQKARVMRAFCFGGRSATKKEKGVRKLFRRDHSDRFVSQTNGNVL